MLYNIDVKHKIQDSQFSQSLYFKEPIVKDKFLIITLCATVAYFLQKVKTDLLVSDNKIYYKDLCIARVNVLDDRVDVIFDMNQVSLMNKKLNPMLMNIGLKAYYNIYFNLYQNNEYSKIEEYYLTIQK